MEFAVNIDDPRPFRCTLERKWTVATPIGDYIVWAECGSDAKEIVWQMTHGRIEKSDMVIMLASEE